MKFKIFDVLYKQKKLILIFSVFIIGIIFTFSIISLIRSAPNPEPELKIQAENKENPAVFEMNKTTGKESSTGDFDSPSPPPSEASVYLDLVKEQYREILLLSGKRENNVYPHDYDIDELLYSNSVYENAVEKIRLLFEALPSKQVSTEFAAEDNIFYLNEKLKLEFEHGIFPDKIRIGWPLIITNKQINMPVKFTKDKGSVFGEIILERIGAEWKIIIISVQFSALAENKYNSTYDTMFQYNKY